VQRDLFAAFARLAPEDFAYRHDEEGPDDMPAHIKSALTAVSLGVPVRDGKLTLGTWQGLYLFEHRHAAHRREVLLHIIG
jgi:secondary thiamine-phosphate synthase enzyme